MNSVDKCFAHQVAFCDEVLTHKGLDPNNLTPEQLVDWTEYTLFNVVKEACEVTGNYDWKRHRAPKGVHDVKATLFELVDVQKYLWNAFRLWGITTPEQLAAVFAEKSAIVLDRWAVEKEQVGAVNTKA